MELIAGKDRELVYTLFAKIAEAGSIRDLGYTVCGEKGQEFPASISASVIKDAGGIPVAYIAIIKDLTEQNEMQERLRKAERMAVIGETAAMVGHDLRNPMQGISGAVYMLKTQECNLSENGKEMLRVIEDAVGRSDKIVNDLLDYSRELHLDVYPTNVKSLMDQSLASMKIPKNINVINLTQEQATVEVDIEKMKRVCLNLMKNAVDAMPNGGTLTITNREFNGNLSVSFADTGEGIRKEVLAKIWTPLFTTKAKGMGYGLAIVKRFVEAHGGSVSVDTNPGEGSTFTIRLPLKPRAREVPLA
jgi:signal transduction histidine kinase